LEQITASEEVGKILSNVAVVRPWTKYTSLVRSDRLMAAIIYQLTNCDIPDSCVIISLIIDMHSSQINIQTFMWKLQKTDEMIYVVAFKAALLSLILIKALFLVMEHRVNEKLGKTWL
jgi:hypothetical protein